MKVSKQIREINGEKPDWIMDDIQDIGYWNGMETAAQIAEDLEKETHLNSNQQIVLDVLKKNANQGLDELIVGGITYMNDEEINAIELSQQEELFQVLAAFAQWGLEQEEE
ncbi:hypothetical protein [Enterococcus dongliensis]|uniref:Phage protein n=1 Tax=Enterococcus dongliensis TaxID=2559925 RepID=A0ABU3EQ97_9ENTE|nr:hypothetical protein [Enterococcus dongliensis]MDT2597026.1 hypothetical protein [Enterococcus dongliensis]